MADDLNVILKAILDVSESKKDIAILLNTINKDPSLNKVKLGVDFDSSQLKGAVVEIRELFDVVEGQLKIKKEVETVQNSIGKLTKNITEYNKEGVKYSEEHINKQKEQNKYREKAIQLEKELAIASEKFTYKNLSDVYKYGENIDASKISNIREQFGNLTLNTDGSNIEEIVNKVKLLNKEYDLIIEKAKLQKTISDDKVKQTEKQVELQKKAIQAQEELNIVSKNFETKSLSALYNLGDNIDLNAIKELQNRLSNIKIDADENSIKDAKNQISLILKEFNNITDASKLQKKINDDLVKQEEEKYKEAKKFAEIYDKIKTKLDSLPKSAIGDESQGLYKRLDSSLDVDQLKTLQVEVDKYYKSAIANEKQLNAEQKLKNQGIKETFNNYKRVQDISTKVDKGIADLNYIKTSYSGANIQDFERLENAWKDIRIQIQNGTIDYEEANNAIKKLTNSNKDYETSAKKASTATNSLGDRLKKAFQYFTFYDALQMGKRAVENMVEVIFDLDQALVELRKVSDLTGKSLEDFTRQAYALGSQISKSGSQVIRASTEFARAGYGEDELLNLAESALVLTSIGDGIKDVSESANTIIAVLRGFNKETSETTKILDMINHVSNNASVSFDQVALALTRMSGTMNSSNVKLEESIGMFTAINEILRNAEMSSTALNSISMRMRGLSEEGDAIDGLAPKLNQMFKDIAGIDMTDANGQVRSLFEITNDLAKVWGTLTTNEKTYIAQQSAG